MFNITTTTKNSYLILQIITVTVMKFTAFKNFGSNLPKLNVLAASDNHEDSNTNAKFGKLSLGLKKEKDIQRKPTILLPNFKIFLENFDCLVNSALKYFNKIKDQKSNNKKIEADFKRKKDKGTRRKRDSTQRRLDFENSPINNKGVFYTEKKVGDQGNLKKDVCNAKTDVDVKEKLLNNALETIKMLKISSGDLVRKNDQGSEDLILGNFNIYTDKNNLLMLKAILFYLNALLDKTFLDILIDNNQGEFINENYLSFLQLKSDMEYQKEKLIEKINNFNTDVKA